MKSNISKVIVALMTVVVIIVIVACARQNSDTRDDKTDSKPRVTVGFSQLGAESDWRRKNTESMKDAFDNAEGYELLYDNGQQNQDNQIRAIRTFIQQDVDYLILAPATEEGWDTVLGEARDAGIPVILVDRMAKLSDESLYSCWVGSDFELEGKKVNAWLEAYAEKNGIDSLNIVNIKGTPGSSAEIGRTSSLEEAAEKNGWNIIAEANGDFTQTKAREVMNDLLGTYDDINVVYCENDNEALGVIEALETAGKTAGGNLNAGEIMVLSFDGVNRQAREYVYEGRISCIGECNPDQGALVFNLIKEMEKGNSPDRKSYVEEGILCHDADISKVTVDGTDYPVTCVTEEMIDE